MSKEEPVYENVQKDIENVKEIDERVINFLHVVKQAPRVIQVTTDQFLASLDKLKKNYILGIVKSKKAERKHSDADRYLVSCQREFNFFKFQDDYLNQVSPELRRVAVEKLEKAKLECSMSYCRLQLAVRELELSKEKLCRFSKRAEHMFLTALRSHPDKGWSQLYKNDAQKSKSELKRVSTIPANQSKPTGVRREDSSCKKCTQARRCSEPEMQETFSRRSGKYLVKSQSLNADDNSSDEEFPPPPPPLSMFEMNSHEQTVVADVIDDGRKKRLSDRSTVDEGIGDIDWKPHRVTPEDGSDGTESLESELIADLDRITKLIDSLSSIPADEISLDKLKLDDPATNNTELEGKKEQERRVSNCTSSDAVLLNIRHFPDGLQESSANQSEVFPEPPLRNQKHTTSSRGLSSDDSYTLLTADEISVDSDVTLNTEKMSDLGSKDTEITEDECISISKSSQSSHTSHDNASDPCNISEFEPDVSNHPNNAQLTGHDTHHVEESKGRKAHVFIDGSSLAEDNSCEFLERSDGNVTADDDISEILESNEVERINTHNQRSPKEVRKEHVYEDLSLLPNYKKKKERKKSKMNFLTKVFHGPWEGWEDDY